MVDHSTNNTTSNPFAVTVSRGPIVESRHLVSAVICDSKGKELDSWGNTDSPVYLRSAIKPLQALPLVESGAADAFDVSNRELSLACASHTGEIFHVDAVSAWLKRIGLDISDLECGSHWPSYDVAARALAVSGQEPTAAHNNCSGKHTGFLTTAVHLKEETKGYIRLDHPVQRRIVSILEDFTDLDLSTAPVGTDGCSIPTIGIPLQRAALAFARFADPAALPPARAQACQRIQQAIAEYPEMIAGTDRLCTALNKAAKGKVIAKVGAEAVYLAALPEQGIGIAIKAHDGTTRGAEVALGALLDRLGVMTQEMHETLDPYVRPVLRNRNSIEVGHLQAVFDE